MTMDTKTGTTIELVVDKTIPLLESKSLRSSLSEELTITVGEYRHLLGIELSIKVDVYGAENAGRVLEVHVQGIRQPYSYNTMRRVWQSNVSQHLRDLPGRGATDHRFPDRWLYEYLCGLDHADEKGREGAIHFLSDLAFAALQEAPSCLIGASQVQEYLGFGVQPLQVDVDYARNVIGFLIDQGISVSDKGLVSTAIQQYYRLGKSTEDAAELLFARLRHPRMELIVAPQEFRRLMGGNDVDGEITDEAIPAQGESVSQAARDQITTMEEGLFWELGFYVPDLVWSIDPNMPLGLIGFRANDQVTRYSLFLTEDELLVNATPDHLAHLGIADAIKTTNPASNKLHSVVSMSHKASLAGAGLTTWDRLGYIVLLTAAEIKRRAPQLLTVDDATYQVGQIREYFPALVGQTLRRFSTEIIARVLRALLAERVSIRNMWSILERLIQYDTIAVDASQLIVFDERLPIAPQSTVLRPESWRNYYEFVREGLKRQISSNLQAGRSTIPVYLLETDLEQWLIKENTAEVEDPQGLDEKRHAIRQTIWSEVGVSAEMTTPIILTTTEPRASLHKIIGREMPHIVVVAYSELTPDMSLQPLSRIRCPAWLLSPRSEVRAIVQTEPA